MSGGVRAGSTDRLLEVRPVKLTQETSGQMVKSYPQELMYKLWGGVTFLNGEEKFKSGREMAKIMVQFKFRYTPKLKVTDRIVLDGMSFDLQEIIPGGTRNREYIIAKGEMMESC